MQETHIHPNLLAVNKIPLYKIFPNTNSINSLNLNKLALGSRGQPKRTEEKHSLILLAYTFESHTKFSLYSVGERTQINSPMATARAYFSLLSQAQPVENYHLSQPLSIL